MDSLVLVALAAVTLTGLALSMRLTRRSPETIGEWRWHHALPYVFGANLAFLVQEVALVVTKAPLDGVSSTLFHNSHDWVGEHSNLDALQIAGTAALGALALIAMVATRAATNARSQHGFGITIGRWTTFHAAAAFLINIASGVDDSTEVGSSFAALGLGGTATVLLGVVALGLIPVLGWLLGPQFGGQGRSILKTAAVAVPALIAFRLPDLDQGVGSVLLLLTAAPWLAVGASKPTTSCASLSTPSSNSLRPALAATVGSIVVATLLFPGITLG